MDVFLIVGLGNPGSTYDKTRHNIGFRMVDQLATLHSVNFSLTKKEASAQATHLNGKLIFLKPLEFMNLSGIAVQKYANLYKIPPERILVLHDEVDLPFGTIRLKLSGGTAGHNGLGDIVEKLGSQSFARVRFGVGKPEKGKGDVADFVLAKFFPEEEQKIPELLRKTVERCQEWLTNLTK